MIESITLYRCAGCLNVYGEENVLCECGNNSDRVFYTFEVVLKDAYDKLNKKKNKPLTNKEINNSAKENYVDDIVDFSAGVRFAERHHGITE